MERRFAYSLLQKLLEYLENASVHMQQIRPSSRYSRRESYSTATEDVKFFGKVVCFCTLRKVAKGVISTVIFRRLYDLLHALEY